MKKLDDIELNEILDFEIKDLDLTIKTKNETYTYKYKNELEVLKRISYLLHRYEIEKNNFYKKITDSGICDKILELELKKSIIGILKRKSIFLILDIICLLIFFNNSFLRFI